MPVSKETTNGLADGSNRGYVLLAVISILTLTAMIAAIAVSSARLEAKTVRADIDSSRLRIGITTAIARAVFLLGEDDSFVADGRVLEFELDDMSYRIRLVDDRGLVGLNTADANLLEQLIRTYGPHDIDTKAIVDAILDWRDADSDPRPFGAESIAYSNLGLPEPGNRAFVHTTELRRVAGMTDEIFFAVSPLLSASSTTIQPEKQFAPFAVLQLLDIPPAEQGRIMDAREFGKSANMSSPETGIQDTANQQTDSPAPESQATEQIFHAFVEVQSQNKARRAERLQVRINSQTGELDLYGRQVIDYGSFDKWFEERDGL